MPTEVDSSSRDEAAPGAPLVDSLATPGDSPVDDRGAGEGGQQAAEPDEADTVEDVARRYLPSPEEDGASTEKRRPVDVFFPDRRAEPRANGRQASGSKATARQRASMPGVDAVKILRTPRSPAPSRAGSAAADQPGQSDAIDPAIQVDKTPGGSARSSQAGSTAAAVGGEAGSAELKAVRVADIHPNPRQPREVFDEDDMAELVASITEVGVLQPIVVREVDGPTPYELVMGERRWRASQRAGLSEIPAIVRHTADTDLLRDALLENLHRSQLNPLEEAAAYEQLLEDFACTQEELSSRIGRSRPQISNTLRLLKLPPLVQRRVASGVLSAGHARALLALVDPAEMERLAQKVVSEGLSVRATEELVSLQEGIRQAQPKARAPRTERHERLDYLANTLTDQLDTTVKITLGARKGKIAIDFASVEDLNRIMALIQPSGANAGQH
ncbi:ParB/RepB/Spo0J family partition protein [Citricoccus sp. SGAir0253]|uniref:ParB/RepB/Spo0J family partition protein n=1 Tax=Citricoccus sp. SGAir0253 TaxID=2567881 RepID=UPI001FEF73AC|nr:ParB/RepB/Spo0J family partition protein [Citricoccus sp. SGAir0253]